MKTIYIGIENGQETVVEVTMEKPDPSNYGKQAMSIYWERRNEYKRRLKESTNRYIVPFPIPEHWKIGEEVQEGKDFMFQHQTRATKAGRYLDNPYWIDCTEDVFKTTTLPKRTAAKPIVTEVKEEKTEFFLPPDNGDACWEEGAQSFSRKEVFALLHTQRAMIGNDLKSQCGNELTDKMYDIINNPRIPKF